MLVLKLHADYFTEFQGKTETAIAPFLFAKTLHLDFPNKLIYVVPLRTLANSLRQRAEILIDRWSQVHQLPYPIVVTLQTGENLQNNLTIVSRDSDFLPIQ